MSTKNQSNQVNLIDILLYLLRHWYLFVICAGIAVAYAYYKYTQMPFVYKSNATVIIKDPKSQHFATGLNSYSSLANRVNMTLEILQLRSKNLMSEVVKTLDADVNYSYRERLRDVELYRKTPVRLFFSREDETFNSFSAKIIPVDNTTIKLEKNGVSRTVTLGDTVTVDNHKLVFKPTSAYSPYYFGKVISINKVPVLSAANTYISKLVVSQGNGAILRLSLQDFNAQRSIDILNVLIDKYNEDAIREKNHIAVNTAQFINERLLIIQEELGGVEDQIARFKTSERIMNVDQATTQYLTENKGYNEEIIKVEDVGDKEELLNATDYEEFCKKEK